MTYFLKRLYWDLIDRRERQYYGLWLISQVPCAFGDLLRSNYCSKRFRKCGINLRVQAGSRFRSIENLEVGDNVTIGFDNFIQSLGNVFIGNDVLIGPGVKIWSVNHGYEDPSKLIRDQPQDLKTVTIGNDVWIGANAFISPGVELPEGCIVSAGSVVTVKNYKPYSIIAGNPGRIVGYRSIKEENE